MNDILKDVATFFLVFLGLAVMSGVFVGVFFWGRQERRSCSSSF